MSICVQRGFLSEINTKGIFMMTLMSTKYLELLLLKSAIFLSLCLHLSLNGWISAMVQFSLWLAAPKKCYFLFFFVITLSFEWLDICYGTSMVLKVLTMFSRSRHTTRQLKFLEVTIATGEFLLNYF